MERISPQKSFFSSSFQSYPKEKILQSIKEKGYFSYPNALTNEFISQVEFDATSEKLNINKNKISGVYTNTQYYFPNLLAVSKVFFDFISSNFIKNLCSQYFDNKFRLKALRYYETYGRHNMQWHSDNKTDKNFAEIPGLIFIFYISDVEDGEFQYIEGSHRWSGEKFLNDYSDDFIEKNYKKNIKSFKLPKGSLIIYNTYGIHRAKPVNHKNFVRKSVFFQIDGTDSDSEPIFLNASYLDNNEEWIRGLFGFGKPSNYSPFPQTSLKTIPFPLALKSAFTIFLYSLRSSVIFFLPLRIRKIIERIIKSRT